MSGGADSVALLRIALELRQELGIVLSVVHLNHKLRAEESDADEAFVRELAAANGLEVVCESRDVKGYAAEKKLSLEAAARELRYEFFRAMLDENLDRIAIAHPLLLFCFRTVIRACDVSDVMTVVPVGIQQHERRSTAFARTGDERRGR